jgi:hypothetical protein
MAAWVPALAAALQKPESQKATRKAEASLVGKFAETSFSFQLPGLGRIDYERHDAHHEVWRAIVTLPDGVLPEQLAPPGGAAVRLVNAATGRQWTEITAGPLVGAFVSGAPSGGLTSVVSFGWIQPERETEIGAWLCEHERIHDAKTGQPVKTKPDGEVKAACEALVTSKLLSPKHASFPGLLDGPHKVATNVACEQEWFAWVDTKNAFNADVRLNFTCTYDPRTDAVSVKVQR